jgi:hypothetical protein
LTLAEVLVSTAVMSIIALTLGSLMTAVHVAQEHIAGRNQIAQHGRVALEHIRRDVETAYGNESFPACLVFAQTVGSFTYPDRLVVWKPTGAPAAPTGLPRVNELIVFAPDPNNPRRLLECTLPSNTSVVPATNDVTAWFTLLDSFLTGSSAQRVELTNLVRTDAASTSSTRGCVRFNVVITPSESQWASYRAGTTTWDNVSWPLDFRGANFGPRRVVCQTELQLTADSAASKQEALPFFGSAVCTYLLPK